MSSVQQINTEGFSLESFDQAAGLGRRFCAFIVDQILISLFFIPVGEHGIRAWVTGEDLFVPWHWIVISAVASLAFRTCFLYFLSATPGKFFLGLRVVSYPDCNSLSFLQSLLRALADSLSLFFGYAPRTLALMRFDRRQVSDWIAETWVTQKAPLPRPNSGYFDDPPRPHIFLALVLSVYLAGNGLAKCYFVIHHSEWDKRGWTFFSTSP